jgi:hypothetical protein
MGAAGSPHATFQRAIARRNLTVALAVARELPMVTLADALALTLLILERDPPRYTAAAMRWAARFALEVTPLPTVTDGQLLLAALAALPTRPEEAAATVASICRSYGLDDAADVATRAGASSSAGDPGRPWAA